MKATIVAVWTAVVILVVIALAFAAHRVSSLAAEPSATNDEFDARYVAHRVAATSHIVTGGFFLLFAPFQFFTSIRRRHPAVHRWSGRFLVGLAAIFALSGLTFGVLWPFGGAFEKTATVAFASFFLFALTKAVRSIRTQDVIRHREWMIRMFSIALGVSVIRIAVGMLVATTGHLSSVVFGLSFWIGWSVSIGIAELWIRRTRAPAQAGAYDAG